MMELVEREESLQTLTRRLQAAGERGHVVFVAGEAGVGKTSLLRKLAESDRAMSNGAVATNPVWWGACDALDTPHPLAPLLDIARDAAPAFAKRLDGPRLALFEAVLDELRLAPEPVLVVVEDAHWADDATLDLLKFLGRRIERTRALLIVSYRNDEVPAGHPLRRLIGELGANAFTRVELARLSPEGVATLARRALRSPAGLFAATQGNPFFVTELLRHGVDEVPSSVQDLVLARFARLDAAAQAIVRLAAIVPGGLEHWLLDAVLAPAPNDVDACLGAGLLIDDATMLRFRHELARTAVESSLTPPVARALHAGVLKALEADGRAMPSARFAHHAALAGNAAAVRRYAPAAADEAWAHGASHEAARHYRAALTHADGVDEAERQRWLDAYAEAMHRIDDCDEATRARQQLDVSLQRSGPVEREAANLCRLAQLHAQMLRLADADAASRRAIDLLEALPPGAALATAYGTEAVLRMLTRDCDDSVAWSRKAIAIARQIGDELRLWSSLSTLGTALMFIDYDAGREQMEAVIAHARAHEMTAVAMTAMLNIGSASGELMRLETAEHWLREAVAYGTQRELDASVNYSSGWLALCELYRGRWADAGERAGALLARGGTSAITRVMSLIALGRLRLRRGDPGVDSALADALECAGVDGTLQRVAPVRAARAEAAYARGDLPAVAAEAEAALPLALRHRHAWFIGELAFWCWRAGRLDAPPPGCAEPYALQITGRWRDAAALWRQLDCPYESAGALADGDVDAQRDALQIFEQLGALPAAEALKLRMRQAGVRGLTRGPRATTREHPFGLTTRELQVLQLLCDGLRNADIAERISRSVRTVDHHIAAVFGKLGVETRVAAVQTALGAGLGMQSGQERSAK